LEITKINWDYLIILDACRYDFFKKIYKKYFSGNLKKRLSIASETREWLIKNFKDRYDDIVYVSANPYVNSKNVKINVFKATEHFHKVIDVWEWGWNDQLNTVHPEKVNEATLQTLKLYPDKRMIIHYMQPHAPYISLNKDMDKEKEKNSNINKPSLSSSFMNILWGTLKRIMGDNIKTVIIKNKVIRPHIIFGRRYMWKHRDWWSKFALFPDDVAFWSSDQGLVKAYEENLTIVMKYVAKLVKHLHGVVVITSDHGELLGERGEYSHDPGKRSPELIEIPWLESININE